MIAKNNPLLAPLNNTFKRMLAAVYKVDLSSDPPMIKKLILQVAYELHLGYKSGEKNTLSIMKDSQEDNERKNSYLDFYNEIKIAVGAVQIDAKHFVFQLPWRTKEGAEVIREKLSAQYFSLSYNQQERVEACIRACQKKIREQDYIYVVFDDESASRVVPEDWYRHGDLEIHSLLGDESTKGSKSTENTSNETNNRKSINKNHNTKDKMKKRDNHKD